MLTTPRVFVDPIWLDERLTDDPRTVVVDASLVRTEADDGTYRFANGRAQFVTEGHIPHARHADLITDFSDQSTGLPFSRPSADEFQEAARALGVNPDSVVVTYDRLNNSWSSRLWLLFKSFGHTRTYILNGGLSAWRQAGFETATGEETVGAGHFRAVGPDDTFVDIDAVFRIVDGTDPALLINVLAPAVFAGIEQRYRRPGRIPGSINDPFEGLIDPATNLIRTERIQIHAHAAPGRPLVLYCGGGIYASGYAAALYESNIENVSVYDGSLSEWAADPSLPLIVDSPTN